VSDDEWLKAEVPSAMLSALYATGRRSNGLKFVQLGAVCCRRVWHLLSPRVGRLAVECVEAETEGGHQTRQVRQALADEEARSTARPTSADAAARSAVRKLIDRNPYLFGVAEEVARAVWVDADSDSVGRWDAERRWQCDVLRDLFGWLRAIPTPPPPEVLAHDGRLVVNLAQAAWEERLLPGGELNPARLAVLADALLDAGCADVALLDHLRSPTPHVRGCWAIDLLLPLL
jgi:hypothetical protein